MMLCGVGANEGVAGALTLLVAGATTRHAGKSKTDMRASSEWMHMDNCSCILKRMFQLPLGPKACSSKYNVTAIHLAFKRRKRAGSSILSTISQIRDAPPESRDVPSEPQGVPSGPQDVPSIEPQNIPSKSQNTPPEPHNVPSGPQNVPFEPQDVPSSEPQNIPSEPLVVIPELQDNVPKPGLRNFARLREVVAESLDTTAELIDATAELNDVTTEPRNAPTEPRKAAVKRDNTVRIQETTAGPQDTTARPQYNTSGLRDTTTRLRDTTTGIRDATAGPAPRATAGDISIFQHPDWYDRADKALDLSLTGAQAGNWKRWTVKLEFTQQGSKRTGTAFYINLDQKFGRILLTAGHNLISNKGEMVQDMKISDTGESIAPEQIFIAEEYKNNPTEESKIHDYGMILLPGPPQGGFGFSLKMAEAQGSEMKLPAVNIIGYHSNVQEPEFYSGRVSRVMPKFIKYSIKSVPGNSGGPVWVGGEGGETVIGIHNYGGEAPTKGKKSSNSAAQGTRIHLGVIQDICRWTAGSMHGVGHLSMRLAVCGLKPPHDKYPDPEINFYLKFTKGVATGKARLGAEDLDTTFDVVPGLTYSWASVEPTGPNPKLPPAKYVFMFNEPASWQVNSDDEDSDASGENPICQAITPPRQPWLRWRTDRNINRVELSEKLRDDSFVTLDPKAKGFQVVQGQNKLRMMVDQVEEMPPEGPEGLYELYESERVGFIPAQDKHTTNLYCVFKFA
ncbi:hypothetical protein TWF506_004270 [Arthrobotrys conoides]|uniref:Serine protease n=1 Tax=Arthrobotrys conoides TaxID=74498 RepID=A0AAN8NA30_9PEZI